MAINVILNSGLWVKLAQSSATAGQASPIRWDVLQGSYVHLHQDNSRSLITRGGRATSFPLARTSSTSSHNQMRAALGVATPVAVLSASCILPPPEMDNQSRTIPDSIDTFYGAPFNYGPQLIVGLIVLAAIAIPMRRVGLKRKVNGGREYIVGRGKTHEGLQIVEVRRADNPSKKTDVKKIAKRHIKISHDWQQNWFVQNISRKETFLLRSEEKIKLTRWEEKELRPGDIIILSEKENIALPYSGPGSLTNAFASLRRREGNKEIEAKVWNINDYWKGHPAAFQANIQWIIPNGYQPRDFYQEQANMLGGEISPMYNILAYEGDSTMQRELELAIYSGEYNFQLLRRDGDCQAYFPAKHQIMKKGDNRELISREKFETILAYARAKAAHPLYRTLLGVESSVNHQEAKIKALRETVESVKSLSLNQKELRAIQDLLSSAEIQLAQLLERKEILVQQFKNLDLKTILEKLSRN